MSANPLIDLVQQVMSMYDDLLKYGYLTITSALILLVALFSRVNRSQQSFQLLLFLLGWLPFFVSFRYQPNPVFPSELVALTLMTLIALAGALLPDERREPAAIPWATLPWGGLILALALQAIILPVYYWSDRSIPGLYALIAALGVWSLARARKEFGGEVLAQSLAWGLLCGAVFNSIIASGQVFEMLRSGHFQLVFGNIGQKNMYGHYIGWGMASAAWLAARREIPKWLFAVLAVWLALAMAWSSSRSPFLYAGAWFVIGAFLAWRANESVRRFGALLAINGLLIIAMQFVAPLVNEAVKLLLGLNQANTVPTGLDRLDSNGARRLVEWQKAWQAFVEHPLLGLGWGAYPQQSVALQVQPHFAVVEESVLFTHAHNSVLNLLAELGLVGCLLIVAGLLAVFAGLRNTWREPLGAFGVSLAIVSLLHSAVEYPLWYFHFIAPFAIALFFINSEGPRLLRWPAAVQRSILTFCATLGIVLCFCAGVLYCQLYPVMDASDNAEINKTNQRILNQLARNPLTDYYAEQALTNYIYPSTRINTEHLELLRRINAVRPYPADLAHLAIMETLQGNAALGHTLMRQAAFAFPENIDYLYDVIGNFREPQVRALRSEIDDAMMLLRKDKQLPQLKPLPAPASAASAASPAS
ncbi:Wzy polymerase domain-containing protein [Chitinilyticum piscinae]|uniref:O-antigen ligase C-terminal domain-containing protein n=1 Tax=Chitinilyticum piscinae TaxID=2866724 RepID=A0A8J7FR08_9NEIS|nr:Wzy polymerase domain-containing protein [Chitinilyticum piscinae]MBE9609186.1 O-antigen ligase C-terminal domain-containing protein [Chitinilyticum piscinae]